jgi:hypothetical protein
MRSKRTNYQPNGETAPVTPENAKKTRFACTDDKRYYVYAASPKEALQIFRDTMKRKPSGGVKVDDEPWKTELHEGRRAPGA